jgi:hypothetical protein
MGEQEPGVHQVEQVAIGRQVGHVLEPELHVVHPGVGRLGASHINLRLVPR